MNRLFVLASAFRSPSLILIAIFLYAATGFPQSTQSTPTETVRSFYKALQEKRFRDALSMSVFKYAIEGLSEQELEELRPEFEKLAAGAEKVVITGEQVTGDQATVFVKLANDEASAPPAPVPLMKAGGAWIVGDPDGEKAVRDSGKEYFFKARIDTHEAEARAMLQRIGVAQLVYSQKHNGMFADLFTLIADGLVPKDIETTDSTGYRYRIVLSDNKRSYSVYAEPDRYGRTGKLSFYMDQRGIQSADVGGKPYSPPTNN